MIGNKSDLVMTFIVAAQGLWGERVPYGGDDGEEEKKSGPLEGSNWQKKAMK